MKNANSTSTRISEDYIKDHSDFLYDQIEKKDKIIERLWSLLGNENMENEITKNWIIYK
jgi:hypothetical protein